MRTRQNHLLIFIVLISLSKSNARKNYDIKIEKVKTTIVNEDYLAINITLLANPRGEQHLDMEFIIKQEMPTYHIRAVAKLINRNSEITILNKSMDVCKFFSQSSRNTPLVKLIVDEMNKKGLNITQCPIPAGNYASKGFYINDSRIPPIVPPGRVYIRMDHMMGRSEDSLTHLVTVEVTATIKSALLKSGLNILKG